VRYGRVWPFVRLPHQSEWNYIGLGNGHSWLRIRNRAASILYHVRMGSFAMAKSHVEWENGTVDLSGTKPLSAKAAQGCPFDPEQRRVTPAIKPWPGGPMVGNSGAVLTCERERLFVPVRKIGVTPKASSKSNNSQARQDGGNTAESGHSFTRVMG